MNPTNEEIQNCIRHDIKQGRVLIALAILLIGLEIIQLAIIYQDSVRLQAATERVTELITR